MNIIPFFTVCSYVLLRCKEWVKALGIQELEKKNAVQLSKNYKICQDHFATWCFMNPDNKQRLVHNAIPLTPSKPTVLKDYPDAILVEDSTVAGITEDSSVAGITEDSAVALITEDVSMSTHSHYTDSFTIDSAMAVTSTPILQATPSARASSYKPRRKYTPRKLYMAKALKRRGDSLRWYKSQHKPKKITRSMLKEELIKNCVDKKLAQFLVRQLDLSEQNPQSRRFTFKEKLLAYNIACKSKSAYELFRTMLPFPSNSTVRRFVAGKMTKPGINKSVLNSIATIMKDKPLPQKIFGLVFDEFSVKPQLEHNPTQDNICGFEDFGELGRSQKVATQALVFMIRSLQGKKKLPLCFYLSNGPVSSDNLKRMSVTLIENLTEAGVNIKVLICDQAASNCRLFKILGIDTDKPYFERNGKKIYGVFDPPHLLKTLRRNLMKNDLVTPKGIVSFKHIQSFYVEDQKRSRQLAPRLTDKHVYAEGLNSMNVKLASQIFSNSVSAGMCALISGNILPAECAATAHFIGIINDLFDSCNGSRKYPENGKKYKCAVTDNSPHLQFWTETVQFIKDSYFIDSRKNEAPQKKKKILSKALSGWELTIKSMIGLYMELKNSGFDYMMAKRLNQDCLENYFSQIRSLGGNNSNPTCYQFHSSFKIACVNSLTSVSKNKNCLDDEDEFLIELIKSPSEENGNLTEEELQDTLANLESKLHFEDGANFDFLEENVIAYLAGYIAKRVQDDINCQICLHSLINDQNAFTNSTIFIYFKQYLHLDIEHGLRYPTMVFLKCIKSIVYLCDELFLDILVKDNVLHISKEAIKQNVDLDEVCQCSEHRDKVKNKILNISSKLYLKIHLRELNKSISKNNLDFKKLREIMKKKAISYPNNIE